MPKQPMVVTTRKVALRDFMIFQLKLALDGLKDVVVFQISIGAIIIDFFSGSGPHKRYFYSVVRASERFDRWLDLHGAMQKIDAGETEDGFFGASEAGSDSLLGEIEQIVRGGDEKQKGKPGA